MLLDHQMEGAAAPLWTTFVADGWAELFPLRFVTFAEVGLPINSSDRSVWRFAQERHMVLLTNNRNMEARIPLVLLSSRKRHQRRSPYSPSATSTG